MENWLKLSGATGLDNLELADFPLTGRGIKTLRAFKKGEKILTIPAPLLWTLSHAHADPLLGPVLRSTQPPLSVEDTLALYILFVRSREEGEGYDGLRSHVAAFPETYSSSIFFEEDELEVCAGSSLYAVTKQLEESIGEDYRGLVVGVLLQNREIFPLERFTLEDVSVADGGWRLTADGSSLWFSTSGRSAPCGVGRWILCCPVESRFGFWHRLRIC